jgi:hypothetical protein
MLYTNRLKETIVFIMFLFFSLDSSFSLLAQARAQEVAKEQGFISSMYDKASAAVEDGVKKCKAVASDVVNYSKEILGPLADSAYSCVKDVFKGAWSSTGGAVVDVVKGAGSAIGSAAGCISEASFCKDQIANSGVVTGAKNAATAVAGCVGSPIECARNITTKIRNTAAFVTDLVGKVKEAFGNISADQIRDIVCNLVGSLGAPLLLSIATGGAAAGLLGARIAQAIMFLQKLATVGPIGSMMKLMNLPFEVLMKLTSPMSDRLIALLKKDISLSPKIKEAVMSCSIR